MSTMELGFGIHDYTVEYRIVNRWGVCDCCGELALSVEQLEIIFIVRQKRNLDGKDINQSSSLGKIISNIVQKETIWDERCLSCRD